MPYPPNHFASEFTSEFFESVDSWLRGFLLKLEDDSITYAACVDRAQKFIADHQGENAKAKVLYMGETPDEAWERPSGHAYYGYFPLERAVMDDEHRELLCEILGRLPRLAYGRQLQSVRYDLAGIVADYLELRGIALPLAQETGRKKKPRQPGRPPLPTEREDKQLFERWIASGETSFKEFAARSGRSYAEVQRTVRRHQQRVRRAK